jgi:Ni/Co efflux regulator RcnB
MTAAMALTLMSGTSALAQQNDQHHGGGGGHPGGGATHAAATGGGGGHPGGGGGGHPGGGGGGAGHPGGGAPSGGFHAVAQGVVSHAGAPSGFTPGPHQGGTQGNVHAYSSGGVHGGGAPVGPGGGQPGFQGRSGPAGRSSGVSGPQAGAHAGFTGGARGRFDPGRFPRVIQPSRQFQWRGRAWVGQPGYYSRHWGYGERLPFGWFSSRWYITDYYDYDLPAPPYDYMWVRVGPDALLVNIYTGEVVEAEYGVFY